MLGGDDDVAGQRDLAATPHRITVYRRDDGLVALEVAGDTPERRLTVGLAVAPGRPGGCRLEIVAGRECALACTGDDGDPCVVVVLEVIEDLLQLEVRLVVQGIHDFRAIQRDVDDVPFLLVDRVLVAHAHSYPAGLNFGSEISSVMSSNVTSSGMPMRSSAFGQSTTLVV